MRKTFLMSDWISCDFCRRDRKEDVLAAYEVRAFRSEKELSGAILEEVDHIGDDLAFACLDCQENNEWYVEHEIKYDNDEIYWKEEERKCFT